MTAKEALNNIATISEILVEVSKSHIMSNKAINEIRKLDIGEIYFTLRQTLTELEELKKRDTAMKPVEAMITWQCGKCGKEIRNTFNSCPYCRTRIDWSGIYGSEKDE